jgi:esterase/lipase superfamily enzyme
MCASGNAWEEMTMSRYTSRVSTIFLYAFMGLTLATHAQTSIAQLRIGSAPLGAKEVVRVLYASDRSVRGGQDHRKYFGVERAPLHYGVCEVGIPPSHRMGLLEGPWRWPGRWDPATDVIFATLELDDDFTSLLARARQRAKLSTPHDVFVFVHGYANSFEDACRRTAQMWIDLQLNGVPIMYSWASAGELQYYKADLETIEEWTRKHFTRFLSTLIDNMVAGNRVHLVAHSMGSRPLMEALASIGSSRSSTNPPFDQVVFFAPEIPSVRFQELLPNARKSARRLSLYASTEDKALQFARSMYNDAPRAGDLRTGPTGIEGIDMIDATSANYSMNGHTYYGDSRSVINDLKEVLTDVPVDKRREIRRSPIGHFEFRP